METEPADPSHVRIPLKPTPLLALPLALASALGALAILPRPQEQA